jgi:hypothetical protein
LNQREKELLRTLAKEVEGLINARDAKDGAVVKATNDLKKKLKDEDLRLEDSAFDPYRLVAQECLDQLRLVRDDYVKQTDDWFETINQHLTRLVKDLGARGEGGKEE